MVNLRFEEVNRPRMYQMKIGVHLGAILVNLFEDAKSQTLWNVSTREVIQAKAFSS